MPQDDEPARKLDAQRPLSQMGCRPVPLCGGRLSVGVRHWVSDPPSTGAWTTNLGTRLYRPCERHCGWTTVQSRTGSDLVGVGPHRNPRMRVMVLQACLRRERRRILPHPTLRCLGQ